jgi:hypothetical protein
MKSSQINFYLNPIEYELLTKMVHDLGFLILAYDAPDNKPKILDQLAVPFCFKYLALAEQLELLYLKKVNDSYIIDQWDSPVISFTQSFIKENKVYRGRFYYLKDQRSYEMKNEEFLKKSELLFKTFKKKFPNAKLEGYEGLWVSPQAAQLQQEGYYLVPNF